MLLDFLLDFALFSSGSRRCVSSYGGWLLRLDSEARRATRTFASREDYTKL